MNLLRISAFLQERCQINPDDRVAVGVSGGVDSVALLHILKSLGYPVVALHFNHQIRPDADRDADFVRALADKWGIQCEIHSRNVPEFAESKHLSLEEAGRILRYRFLFSTARRLDVDALATAHHANDQAETVMMHFIRGSGLDGLKGMLAKTLLSEFDESIPLVRPLLYTWKQDLLEYCRVNQLEYVEDSTNYDPSYFRNELRLHLLPQIEKLNPRFQQVLVRSTESLQADLVVLDHLVETAWDELQIREGNGFLFVDVKAMQKLDLGIRFRVIRKAIQRLKKDLRDIDFAFVKRFSDFIDLPSQTNRLDIGSGLRLRIENGLLYLLKEGANIPVVDHPQLEARMELAIPWQVRLQYGWVCSAEEVKIDQVSFDTIRSAGRWDAWLDLDQVNQLVELSTRVMGERFSPLGGEGHSIKISDLFINHKIPTSAREKYPLIKDADGIIWVPGIQIADRFRVTEQTKRLLRIHMSNDRIGLLQE